MRRATLTLTATQLDTLAVLPAGFGRSLHRDGLHLDVTADGRGGVGFTARTDSSARRTETYRAEQHRTTVREETAPAPEHRSNTVQTLLWGMLLGVVAVWFFAELFVLKRNLFKHAVERFEEIYMQKLTDEYTRGDDVQQDD